MIPQERSGHVTEDAASIGLHPGPMADPTDPSTLGRARMIEAGGERGYVHRDCPSCDHTLKVRSAYEGKAVLCKFCGHHFVISSATDAPTILPISVALRSPRAAGSTSSRPSPEVIGYLASWVAEEGRRNDHLEAEGRRLRGQVDDLRAELARLRPLRGESPADGRPL